MASDQQQRAPGNHYSGSNRVPDIKTFVQTLDREKQDRDRLLDEQRRQNNEATPHQATKAGKEGTRKTVHDPTTQKEVQIEDVSTDFVKAVKNPQLSVPNANLGKDTTVKTDSSQPYGEYKRAQDVTAPPDPVAEGSTSDVPIHGEKTNILFHPTPSVSYEPMFASLETKAGSLCFGVFLAIVVLGKMFGGSLKGLIPTAACIVSGIWLWMKEVVRSGREVEWSSEQLRGETATANLLPESVEWMNTLLGIVWGLINPEMFAAVADTLEDVMGASVPSVIENVRVAEINQGNNPIRILSLRALPDTHVKELKDSIHKENKMTKDPQEAAADEEGGDYYNLEASFAYHAKPSGNDSSSKARNMHMQLVFYLGIKGLFGVPLPIFVELQGLVGTVRLRLQMTPEPPFLKNLTFTLMGLPQVQAGCIPMVQKGINILDLPLISNFVNYAIGAAASMYVAPKSMTLDIGKMLQGDDIQKDVIALGVLWIRIHSAKGLSKQDKRGSKGGGSDPYITLSFSKYGKPMYCTRVITDDLNPIWEEAAALLVTPELIKADEQLSVELWDSDRSSADDIVGKIELSMQKMIQHPGKMYPQVSKLRGMEADSEMPGELRWEVGYFGKPKFRPGLRTDGKDPNLPDALKNHKALQDEKGSLDNEDEDAVAHTPPDPLWPSGVCSVVIHQIVNLELENIQGSEGSRKGREYEPAKEAGENTEEEGKKLPSSYCTILFNDQLVYRTRTKVVSSKPIFNAGTERFLRDWKSGIITVTVRDQRHRQHDPILGVVPLKLSELLQTSSQVTRWYPLDGGIGFGRIRISLLFRSIETRLPPNMLGWDVGTFEFTSDRILALNYHALAKLKMRTGGSTGAIRRTQCQRLAEGNGVFFDIAKQDGKNNVRLPVKFRYRSPVVFEFHTPGKRGAAAYATIWLHHLVDNEETDIDIPIWTTKYGARLTQNYITEENTRSFPGLDDLEEIGRLQFRCLFKAGTDEDHEKFVVDNETRETFETWEACLAEGVRDRRVTNELPPKIQELHEKSLTEGRDVLAQAGSEEREKWLTKDGQDWSGAFTHDPKAYMDSSGRKRAEPGKDKPFHDPFDPSSDDDLPDESDDDSDDLGIQDGTNDTPAKATDGGNEAGGFLQNSNGETRKSSDVVNKKSERRKHRGLLQWKPVRNLAFAKDGAKFSMKKIQHKLTGGLEGREPGVETEVNGPGGLGSQKFEILPSIDYDCFYAAVFEREDPKLRFLPLAVQQKQIIVTCNYEARRRGLHKLQLIREARKQCPDVVIVMGEDLTRFRDASKELYNFLKAFSWSGKVERLGFDEVFMDVTDLIEYNLGLLNRYDLRACFFHLSRNDPTLGFNFDASRPIGKTFPAAPACCFSVPDSIEPSAGPDKSADLSLSLILGSYLARYLRYHMEEQKGFTATVGISINKLLSKLVGNLNKPQDQTTFISNIPCHLQEFERNVSSFIDCHEIGKIPGIGFKISQKIREYVLGRPMTQQTGLMYSTENNSVLIKDVRLSPGMGPALLEKLIGGPGIQKNIGFKVWNLIHGIDDSAVSRVKDLPRQISIEDSYLKLTDIREVEQALLGLMRSLLKRMRIDLLSAAKDVGHDPVSTSKVAELGHWVARPRTLRLTTRPRPPLSPAGSRSRSSKRISKSCEMPSIAFSKLISIEEIAERIVHDALIPLFHKLHPEISGWDLSLINLCAANFLHHVSDNRDGAERDISHMFRKQVEILKGWNSDDDGITHNVNVQNRGDMDLDSSSSMTDANISGEVFHDEREGPLTSIQGKHLDESGFNRQKKVADVDDVCEICGAHMPVFAILAHERFHNMSG